MEMRDEKGVPLKPVPLTDRDGAARVCFSSFHFLLIPCFFSPLIYPLLFLPLSISRFLNL